MEVPDEIHCLFSGQLDERDGSYIIEIPARELELGNIDAGETYRVGLLARRDELTPDRAAAERGSAHDHGGPPVREGETREVEIEDVGEQGDGIARVERGFVVIVPDTEVGERVTIEITQVRENVAFAEVVERQSQSG